MVLPSLERDNGGESRRTVTKQRTQASRGGLGFEEEHCRGDTNALIQAIKDNDMDTVAALLNSGKVSPSSCEGKKPCQQPLCVAATTGNENALALLLEKGFAVNHAASLISARPPKETKANRPAHVSKRHNRPGKRRININHLRVIPNAELSLFHSPIKKVKSGVCSPLHWAAYKGNLRCVCSLLRHGFDPCLPDNDGNNALHLAATACNQAFGDHLIILEILVCEGVPVEDRNAFGNTPYQLATDPRAKEFLRKVIEDPTIKEANLLSLGKLISAEEQLQRQLSILAKGLNEEEVRTGDGWDVFVDGDSGRFTMIDFAELGLSPEEEFQLRSKVLRTCRLRTVVERLQKSAEDLEAAFVFGQACYVPGGLLQVAGKHLLALKLRLKFETEILKMLELAKIESNAVQRFASLIRSAKHRGVSNQVLVRASRVYLYSESKMRLHSLFDNLEFTASASVTWENIQALESALESFLQNRILFTDKQRQEREQTETARSTEQEVESARVGGMMKKKKKTKVAKKGRKTKKLDKLAASSSEEEVNLSTGRSDVETKDSPSEEAAQHDAIDPAASESEERTWMEEPTEDDILLDKVQRLLTKVRLEAQLVDRINEDTSVLARSGIGSRINSLEQSIKRLETLMAIAEGLVAKENFTESEETAGKDEQQQPSTQEQVVREEKTGDATEAETSGSVFALDPALIVQAGMKLRQLNKELKQAKKHLNEKAKNAGKKTGSKPSTPKSSSGKRKKK